jgi:hypothetical protein
MKELKKNSVQAEQAPGPSAAGKDLIGSRTHDLRAKIK